MSPLLIVIAVLTLAVLVVLVLGIINMTRGGEEAARRSNKLMGWRVALQAAVILLLGALMLMTEKS